MHEILCVAPGEGKRSEKGFAGLMQEMPGSALDRHRPKEVRTIFGPSSVQFKRLIAPGESA